MREYLKKILILLFFFNVATAYGASKCKPEYEVPKIPSIISSDEKLKNPVYVFYDSSLSMTGFTRSQDEETNLFRPIINELQQISQSLGTETIYNTFGSRFETIDENRASLVTTESFYTCTQSAQACVKKDKKKATYVLTSG